MERKNFSRAPDFDVKAEQHRACLAGSGAAYSVSSKQATIQGPLPYLEKGGGRGGSWVFFPFQRALQGKHFPELAPPSRAEAGIGPALCQCALDMVQVEQPGAMAAPGTQPSHSTPSPDQTAAPCFKCPSFFINLSITNITCTQYKNEHRA